MHRLAKVAVAANEAVIEVARDFPGGDNLLWAFVIIFGGRLVLPGVNDRRE